MTDQDLHVLKVKTVRQIQYVYWGVTVCTLILFAAVIVLWERGFTSYLNMLQVGLVIFLILNVIVSMRKCPQCGKLFLFRFPGVVLFKELSALLQGECVNCGFPRIVDNNRSNLTSRSS
jgi:hypothetical protein